MRVGSGPCLPSARPLLVQGDRARGLFLALGGGSSPSRIPVGAAGQAGHEAPSEEHPGAVAGSAVPLGWPVWGWGRVPSRGAPPPPCLINLWLPLGKSPAVPIRQQGARQPSVPAAGNTTGVLSSCSCLLNSASYFQNSVQITWPWYSWQMRIKKQKQPGARVRCCLAWPAALQDWASQAASCLLL